MGLNVLDKVKFRDRQTLDIPRFRDFDHNLHMSQIKNVEGASLEEFAGEMGQIAYVAADENGLVRMIMSASSLLEELGLNAHFAGFDVNGRPQFWISADDGSAAFAAGKGKIDSDGISLTEFGDGLYLLGSIGNDNFVGQVTSKNEDQNGASLVIAANRFDPTQEIENGDFETGDFTSWTETDSGTDVSISEDAHGGSYAVLFTATGSGSTNNIAQSVTSGQYYIEFYAKSENGAQIIIGGSELRIPALNEWNKYTVLILGTVSSIKIYMSVGSDVLLDDILVYPLTVSDGLELGGTAPTKLHKVTGVTSAVQEVLNVNLYSTGTPVDGFGTQFTFKIEDVNGNLDEVMGFLAQLSQVSGGSPTSVIKMRQVATNFGILESALPAAGWAPYAYPIAFNIAATYSTTINLPANGGSIAIPVEVKAPMLLESVSVHQISTSGARAWRWDLYVQNTNTQNAAENTLTRVAASNGSDSFTASAVGPRTLSAASEPIYISPGTYWLVIQCTHATNAFQLGASGSLAAITGNTSQTKTTTNPNGDTLDFVAATWSKRSAEAYGVRLNGQVFGQNTAF